MKNAFEPPTFRNKTMENACKFLSSLNNCCKLNQIDGQDKIFMFEMCLKYGHNSDSTSCPFFIEAPLFCYA